MYDIFLSYDHRDRSAVHHFKKALEGRGWSVWWDGDMRPGERYFSPLESALSASRCVVVCWSPASVESENVRSEAHWADARKRYVPVMIQPTVLPPPFNEMATVDLTGWPDSDVGREEFDRLHADLEGRVALAVSGVPIDTSAAVPGFGGRPAVAVLPFVNDTGEVGVDVLARGFAAEVSRQLQRYRWIPVISDGSTDSVASSSDLRDIGTKLGAKYVLTGRIERGGSDQRILVELSRVDNRQCLWNLEIKGEEFVDFSAQDRIALQVVGSVAPEIERAEEESARTISSHDAAVWELVRLGEWHQRKLSVDGASRAKALFDAALQKDPDSVEALIHLAWWHFWDKSSKRAPPAEWEKSGHHAHRALALAPGDSRAQTLVGIWHMMMGQHEQAQRHYRRAIELNPSFAFAHAHLGSSLYLDGHPEESLAATKLAIRLSPLDFFVFHAYCDMATAQYMRGEYSAAIAAADYSLSLRHGYWLAHVVKVASLHRAGERDRARLAVRTLKARKPNVSRNDIDWIMFRDKRWNEQLAADLEAAG